MVCLNSEQIVRARMNMRFHLSHFAIFCYRQRVSYDSCHRTLAFARNDPFVFYSRSLLSALAYQRLSTYTCLIDASRSLLSPPELRLGVQHTHNPRRVTPKRASFTARLVRRD